MIAYLAGLLTLPVAYGLFIFFAPGNKQWLSHQAIGPEGNSVWCEHYMGRVIPVRWFRKCIYKATWRHSHPVHPSRW